MSKRILFFLFFIPIITPVLTSAQTGEIRGHINSSTNNEPLSFASIFLQGTNIGAFSDSSGFYELKKIIPGLYNIEVRYLGYKNKTVFEVQVTASRIVSLDIPLEEEICLDCDTIIIMASPFTKTVESPLSIRTIGVNEIQRNPGGNRDISRVIQSLPGVASSVSFRNDIIIRGGAPNENRFYLDGIEVPNINHFSTQGASGGPVGMINVDFIREVDFYSGAFPASRSNMLSSLMDIKLRNGKEDKLGFRATLGSSDLALTTEGPLGKNKKTTFIASARRSYLQGLFTLLGLPFLPTYNDFQFKTNTKFNAKNELTVIGLGAIDQFKLNLKADSTESQKYILGYLPGNSQWNYTMGMNFRHFTNKGYWNFVLSRNMLNNRAFKYENNDALAPLILDYTSREMENKARWEMTRVFSGFTMKYGLNYEYVRYLNSTYNRVSTPAGPIVVDFNSAFDFHKYGAFFQIARSFIKERLSLSLGIRADGNSYSKEMSNPLRQFSPRFAAAFNLSQKIALNFNTGIYYQLPPYTVMGYKDADGSLVNRNNQITYIHNIHLIGGVEYNYQPTGKITVEGFYKRYFNYPFLLRDGISLANLGGDFGVIGNEPVTSTSAGRSYGLEFMVQQKLWKGLYGILAFTLVRSEFTDGSGAFKPSAWDNRHILTFTGGKKFKRNWEFGLRWRNYGGVPYTPTDINRSSMIEVWNITGRGLPDYSRLNTLRAPGSHQLDMRVDKKWFFKNWSLNLYFDVQNVYNFKATQGPYLDVVRDISGNPVPDPNNPGHYVVKEVPNVSGTVLPTLGIVVELR